LPNSHTPNPRELGSTAPATGVGLLSHGGLTLFKGSGSFHKTDGSLSTSAAFADAAVVRRTEAITRTPVTARAADAEFQVLMPAVGGELAHQLLGG
jgi:hypothetical protein